MKVEISTLTVKVNKKKVTLTLEEAKALFDSLNGIFGPKYIYNYPYYSGTLVTSGNSTTSVTLDSTNLANTTTLTDNNLSIVGDK